MIKDKKKIKKKYKLFNFTKRNNSGRKYVNGINKPWWKRPTTNKHQLTEKTFYDVLKIFIPKNKGIISYNKKLPRSKYWRITPDYRIELTDATSFNSKTKKEGNIDGIIFEYDGEKHYNSSLQMHSDYLKMNEIKNLNYRRIRIPFYFQLTEDIAKFIFNGLMFHYTGQRYYTYEKWKRAVKKVYVDPTNEETIKDDDFSKHYPLKGSPDKHYPLIGSPGMHATEYIPASFVTKGLKRFLKDFDWESDRPYQNSKRHPDAKFPKSARHQIIRTLELYINDTDHGKGGNKNIILPNDKTEDGQELHRLYNEIKSSYKKKYLDQVFFGRERYEDIFPELI